MKQETQERLKALEDSLQENYSHLLESTMKGAPVDAVVSLLTYKIELDNYSENVDEGDKFFGFQPSDYEEGYEVRVAALKLLGIIRNPQSVTDIAKRLYDWGDADAGGSGRVTRYFRGGWEVQKAAVETLVKIGGDESLRELEKKLKTYEKPKSALDNFVHHTEVSASDIESAIQKIKNGANSYETYTESNRLWELPEMLRDFSKQLEGYQFNDEYKREEYESTRTNIDKKSRYFLRKGDKEALVLQIDTYLLEDEFGVAVPSGLPHIHIKLLDPHLRGLYKRLTAFAEEIKYVPQK